VRIDQRRGRQHVAVDLLHQPRHHRLVLRTQPCPRRTQRVSSAPSFHARRQSSAAASLPTNDRGQSPGTTGFQRPRTRL